MTDTIKASGRTSPSDDTFLAPVVGVTVGMASMTGPNGIKFGLELRENMLGRSAIVGATSCKQGDVSRPMTC